MTGDECRCKCELSGAAICIFVCSTVVQPAPSRASDLCCGWMEEGVTTWERTGFGGLLGMLWGGGVDSARERVAVGMKATFFVFVSEYKDWYPGGEM